MINKDFKIATPILKRKIGLSSIYSTLNGQHDKTFTGEDFSNFEHTVRNVLFKKAVRQSLAELWNVPARRSIQRFFTLKEYKPMLELLNWFKEEGHRNKDEFLTLHYKKSALAWDIARYTNCIRHGYYLNYINKETSMEHLNYAYELSNNEFESWEDYGRNFLFFKSIWDNDNLKQIYDDLSHNNYDLEDIKKLQVKLYKEKGVSVNTNLIKVVENLLSDEMSLWNKVPWYLD